MFRLSDTPGLLAFGTPGGLAWRLLDGPNSADGRLPASALAQRSSNSSGAEPAEVHGALHGAPPAVIRTGAPRNYHLASQSELLKPIRCAPVNCVNPEDTGSGDRGGSFLLDMGGSRGSDKDGMVFEPCRKTYNPILCMRVRGCAPPSLSTTPLPNEALKGPTPSLLPRPHPSTPPRRIPYLKQQLESYAASQQDSPVPHDLLVDLLNEQLDLDLDPSALSRDGGGPEPAGRELAQDGNRVAALQLSPDLTMVVSTSGQIGGLNGRGQGER